ncbi:MAG: hypothetical protein JNL50_00685 [Phycisphaerae bacterium]|nr:hypothetical protein [Phycisphaerae bacterium]
MNVIARVSVLVLALAWALAGVGGCASTGGPSTFAVAPGGYARAFDAARESLRDEYFSIDRVDAEAGVIVTFPKSSAGLATPWDGEQSTLGQEWEDLAADQRRTVRVVFEREPGSAEASLGRVTVVVDRRYRPGIRVPAKSVRSASLTQDPALAQRGMWPAYDVAVEEDRALAARLAASIAQRLAGPISGESSPTESAPADQSTTDAVDAGAGSP